MTSESGTDSRLKIWREQFLDRHSSMEDWRNRCFSAVTWTLWRAAVPMMATACRGLVLDAGSGRSGWRSVIMRSADRCESLDIAERGDARPDWIGDLSGMPQVPDSRFDSLVCHQVLEHVREPFAAAREIARVMRPGALAVISVPHLSRRHELPHDYFRFTPEGLRHVLESGGLKICEMRCYGGILSFLQHQFSTLVLSPTSMIPILGDVLAALMAPLSMLTGLLDRLLDRWSLAPAGIIALVEKPR